MPLFSLFIPATRLSLYRSILLNPFLQNKFPNIAQQILSGPFLNSIEGIPIKDYYMDSAVKMQTQLKFQDRFPELLCLPGVLADFGAILEPSALG
jgi:hypothetical protein